MEKLEFTPEQKREVIERVKLYMKEELEVQLGNFDAEFLIDFFAEEVGAYFYNQGLYDAQALISTKVDEIGDSIYELERPTGFSKMAS